MQAPWGLVLESIALSAVAPHFFTARTSPVNDANGATNWTEIASSIGVSPDRLWRFNQVHGRDVERIPPGRVQEGRAPRADAGVTGRRDVALLVKVADCVPILLADREGRGVAAVHAGWRGAAAGIVEHAVRALAAETAAAPSGLVAAIGPSIGACCYEVGGEVRDAFMSASTSAGAFFAPRDGKWRLDLWQAVASQLVSAGVRAEDVHVAELCTATHLDWFFSYRKEGTRAGRLLGVIRRR